MSHWLKRLRFYGSWPWLWLYFARCQRARVVLCDEAGRVLLVQGKWQLWYDDPGWNLPGGGVVRGEEAAAAAARELTEELGVRLDHAALRPLGQVRVVEYGIRYTAQLFQAHIPARTVLQLQSQEIAAAQWYHPRELAGIRIKPDVRHALELLGPGA